MILVLMGYMGSGKSTIGRVLAKNLEYDFIDLDAFIETEENASIADIFRTKGEIYFRKKETQCLQTLLVSSKPLVLALGGGTPCYGNNMNVITNSANSKSFYLKLSIPLLAKRLFIGKQQRPLVSHLNTESDVLEFVGKHLFERLPFYNKADFIISTDHKTEAEVVSNILAHLV